MKTLSLARLSLHGRSWARLGSIDLSQHVQHRSSVLVQQDGLLQQSLTWTVNSDVHVVQQRHEREAGALVPASEREWHNTAKALPVPHQRKDKRDGRAVRGITSALCVHRQPQWR